MSATTAQTGMTLKVLLPHRIHLECDQVQRIVVHTGEGWLGLLPHRLDCAAALTPGILYYATASDEERYVAIDAGAMIKTGAEVTVSVRNAISGVDLVRLRELVEQQFVELDTQEQLMRSELAKLESGFIRRYLELQRG